VGWWGNGKLRQAALPISSAVRRGTDKLHSINTNTGVEVRRRKVFWKSPNVARNREAVDSRIRTLGAAEMYNSLRH
jgi:hypothetical protein